MRGPRVGAPAADAAFSRTFPVWGRNSMWDAFPVYWRQLAPAVRPRAHSRQPLIGRRRMKVIERDFAVVMFLVWRQAPALLVFSVLATLLLFGAVYGLQVYDRVLPSGARDTLLWVTPAT